MNKVMQLLDEDLRQGAIGLAAPIAYMAKGLSSYELFEGQKVVGHYGRANRLQSMVKFDFLYRNYLTRVVN